jgi:amidase
MGASIMCLQIVFRHLQSTQPWLHDPDVVEIPWRSEKEIRDDNKDSHMVTFGIFSHDGLVTPHPPIQRAIRMVEAALRASKYEVRDYRS